MSLAVTCGHPSSRSGDRGDAPQYSVSDWVSYRRPIQAFCRADIVTYWASPFTFAAPSVRGTLFPMGLMTEIIPSPSLGTEIF